MSGSRSRRKGHAWERAVAAMIEEATGVECRRELREVREGNCGDVETDLPVAVQCKVGARPNLWSALAEAVEAAGVGDLPIAVLRRNGAGSRPPVDVAAVPLPAFLRLLAAVYGPDVEQVAKVEREMSHDPDDKPSTSRER